VDTSVNAQTASTEQPAPQATLPGWVESLLRVPLIGKIAGANALIAIAAIAVAFAAGMGRQGSMGITLLVAIPLLVSLMIQAVLVMIALRPLQELHRTAQRFWQGELDARVPSSPIADSDIQRVGNTLNVLLDGLNADRARLRALANQVIRAGDRERATLARELHDSTAQTLAALLLELSVLASENRDHRLEERLARIRGIVTDVLDEVRMIAHTVHPRVLDDLGLAAALQLLARESRDRAGIEVTYVGPSTASAVEPASSSSLYRVAQEAVGNAIRHAGARSVTIELELEGGEARLQVIDDGIGFVPDEVERRRPGMGLFTMRERAALVGGRLTIRSNEGRGTRIVATVPLTVTAPMPAAVAAG
jgi:signal transduction histidine kinase